MAELLARLTVRHSVPSIYQYREFAAAGGPMSYGGSITDAYRLVGLYAGRILKGERDPLSWLVQQSTKIELNEIRARSAEIDPANSHQRA
jgi:putative tryptophan/tyrosine transport system substrate-binding protein